MARGQKSRAITKFNLGLYYNVGPLAVPPGALSDGRNFRIRDGRISNTNLGWEPWSPLLGVVDSNTKALLHFNGADASTTIHDSAGVAPWKVWTAAGDAQLDTAQKKFGTASLLCDGTGDWVSTPSDAALNLGSSNFTISMWLRPAADGTIIRPAGRALAGHAVADTEWFTARNADNTFFFAVSDGTTLHFLTSSSTILAGVFTHVGITRSGTTFRLFINGVLDVQQTISGAVNAPAAALRVGAAGEETANPWNGWIDEFALIVGEALWSDNFSVQVGPFQRALSGPVMLIENFAPRDDAETLVIATTRDIYSHDMNTDTFSLITPTYSTATVDVSAANPALVVPDTGTPAWDAAGIKVGDFIQFGTTDGTDPEAPWYEIAVVADAQLTLTTAVTGAALNNVAYVIRRRFTGNVSDNWDTDTFVSPDDGDGDDMIFLTNGIEDVVTWTTDDAVATLRPALGFKAKQLRIFKSMMLYGNLTIGGSEFPTTFINSDVGTPLNVSTGLASEFKAHDSSDPIREMEDLGDNMVIYSERHITLMQFVGDPLVFIFRQAATGIGPISPRVVADFGDYHEFIGADSQYFFDGVSTNESGTQVWREILRARDASRQTLGFLHFDEENGDLIWAIPLAADAGASSLQAPPEEAFVEHYLEIEDERIPDPVSRRAMPFTCGGYSITASVKTWQEMVGTWEQQTIKWSASSLGLAFPINLMGAADGLIYVINTSQTANGTALPSFVRTGRYPCFEGKNRGLLRRIYPFVSQLDGNMQVISRYSDHANGLVTRTEDNLMDLTLPEEGHFVTPYRRGRFYELQFGRDDGNPYELEGYDLDVVEGGMR